MKKHLIFTVIGAALLISICDVRLRAEDAKKPAVQTQQIVGQWYMGTMSGYDCNLTIRPNHTLAVQYGGCFYQDPAIESGWKLQGDRIKFGNDALLKTLGSSLKIGKYKGHFVLLPERPQSSDGQVSYALSNSFWRNTMKDGLEISKDAPR